jgi:hypothetical protein
LSINGYYENDFVELVKKDGSLTIGDLNRFRLRIDSELHKNLIIHLEPRYYFLAKSQTLPIAGISSLDQVVLDRAYAKFYSPLLSITAGKQRIAWGTGYIWNPTDIFNPFVMSFAVREEEENNVEALRLEIPIGAAGGFDGYVLTNKEWSKSKKGVRVRTNIGLFDMALSYVDLGSGSFQAGFDTAGEIKGVGVRNEIVLKSPSGGDKYIQSILGWDCTLENGLGMNMEYYFNGLGKKNKNDYDWTGLYSGTINQLGMDYLYFGLNKIIDELTNVRASFIMNLNDQSFIIYPSYTRSISQDIDLSFEAMLTGGQDGSEFCPSSSQDPTGLAGSKMVLVRAAYNF